MKINKKGFTLIELMVVIAIIGILATSGISMYGTYQAKARDTKRMTNLNTLTIWLQGYYTDKSEYPSPQSGSCLSDENWAVHISLASYYDNKNIPLDPQKQRLAWNCDKPGAPLYKQLSKDNVANTAYIIWSNVEVKSSANLKYDSQKGTYEAFNGTDTTSMGKLADADKKPTGDAIKNVLYAIVNN